ncbi:MAG: ABC transporter permease [Actinobacteria bacterium]|nr:ABC transporter permease [Actinomycetota bacterium]
MSAPKDPGNGRLRSAGPPDSALLPATTWSGRLTDALGGPLRNARNFALVLVAALVAGIPLLYAAGSDPLNGYGALFEGSIGSKQALAETLVSMMPLLLGGLAVAVAFQAGLFNIGVEGQLLMGGLVAGTIGAKLDLPAGIHVLVAVAGAMLAGGLWALIPALLKAFRGVHEVITTIMLNYVAFSVSRYLVKPGGLLVSRTQPSATELVAPSAGLPRIWSPTRLHAGIFIVVVAVGFMWYLVFRTSLGYRFRVVGRNPVAARFHGISPPRAIVQAMLVSGAFAGLAGANEVLGLHHRYFDQFSPGYGFDAIGVALLGSLNPIGVAAAAFFFGMLRSGSVLLQAVAGVSRDMISAFSGLVVGFAAAVTLVDRILGRRRRMRTGEGLPSPAGVTTQEGAPV